MQIVILGLNYAPETSGIAPYTRGLATGLAKRGHDVKVIAGYPHYPAWKIDSQYRGWTFREKLDGVSVQRLRHYVPSSPTNLNRIWLECTYGARISTTGWGNPDVILCVSPALLASAMALARNRLTPKRPPIGLVVQDLYSAGIAETKAAGGAVSTLAAKFEAMVLRKTDGIAVVHERFGSNVANKMGISEDKIRIIRNWTHLPKTVQQDRKLSRSERGWKDNKIIVLHAGNMGVKQGLENVVEAARLADSQLDNRVNFILMGDGNQRSALEIRAKGIRSLQFLDPVPDEQFQSMLADSDVLLVNERPGVEEMSVPSKLTSYFSAGVPVLAATSATGTTGAEIASSNGGIIVTPGDPKALIAGVLQLADNKELSRTLGQAGIAYSRRNLNAEHAIDQYEKWLQELVQQSKGEEQR
ncbi:glycosyltransferase family 4 protein [Rhodococcus qingshengii]|uniref:glycosyltransferase family 4 protein n=1 Tax=Rhodococcus qingshengii TaxID=334542 RepID=UPI00287F49A2|nr:glycosyltransferase family 4 protein [Rhodococcus qingshengii]